jgi:hypothetical protein
MTAWYAGSVEIIDSRTLKITLPDGIKITPGQTVPPEVLEMMASYLRLRAANVLNDAEGCGVQLGRAKPAEGCGVQFGKAALDQGCVLQLEANGSAEGCYDLYGPPVRS